ncbi:hypothetical protein DID88_005643 [Monilinia fructigena]|uniref:Uncharacterized protein n=1 Tax=Monilinia fructigena TaxID=38457 RepID=A0A395J0F8_9HELO|nr:hypothetical protein DID88_005643 [Monilinia fructigena]
MSTQANNELFIREWTTTGVNNPGASLNHLPASFLFTNAWTVEHDLFDDFENFDIADWNNHVGDNHMAPLSSDEFNFANAPNWNYNPDNTTNAPLDQFMNFPNFAPPEPNTNPSDAYPQGFCDALNLFAPVSNMIVGQEFVPAEVDSSIASIERQQFH